MEILVVMVVLGGLWAALLLPSFFESRNDAPLTSTRHFDRNLAKLASLKPRMTQPAVLARRRLRVRRRRVLTLLGVLAFLTLAAVVWRFSALTIAVHLAADVLLLGYLGLLYQLRQRREGRDLVIGLRVSDDDDSQLSSAINR